MAIELTMPALSPTMEKGTLAKWLVTEGDAVKPGDMIAEIETDKATMEFETSDGGRIAKLVIAEGTEDVAVGTVIAMIAADGEEIVQASTVEVAAPHAEPMAAGVALEPSMTAVPSILPAAITQVRPAQIDTTANATPLARRIAAFHDIALASITGTGPNGKIVKADLGVPSIIRSPASADETTATPVEPIIAPPPQGVPVETVKLSSMRKTIARRLSESKSTVPHFYLTARCNLDPLLALRKQLNGSLGAPDLKISVNDMLIKALTLALDRVPEANVQFGGDVLHRFGRVDVSMAVAIDGGLVTPVIRDAGSKSVSAIARESRALAQKARDGRLTPEDYSGGTVSLSNLGMFGIDEMFPVINPPQALILGVAAGVRQPWSVGGEMQLATVMAATASFDHRAIDGAVAASFMAVLKALVENPLEILA